MKPSILFICLLASFACFSQTDTLTNDIDQEDLIESYLQEGDDDSDFDYNDLFEELAYLRHKPLNLNTLAPSDLDQFTFLSPLQKASFLEYRDLLGPFLSEFELQALPYFDLEDIQQLLPFVEVGPTTLEPISEKWKTEGRHQLIMRWSGTLEDKKGFTENAEGEIPYQGDRNALYLRYRFAYSNRLSFGFTAEKDEGEAFFKGSNKQGFDFYSAHFFLQNPNGKLRSLALGDYSVSMGQGLILFNGFSTRKSPLTTQIKRTGRPLRRYSSVNETDFFRGAAATYAFTEKWTLTSFFSFRNRDANIEVPDEITDDEPLEIFATSLQTTGKHRTLSEIADENAVRQLTTGGILKWQDRRKHIAINALYNTLSEPLLRRPALYNQYFFNGKRLFNAGLDYSHTWRNFHFFGETAMSENSAVSTVNGLLVGLDQRMDVALLHRHFPKNYQALNAKPFAETSGGRNENGLYLGVEIRPLPEWRLNAYFDQWQHPWLRFRTDAPGNGHEWLARVTFKKRKKMEAHLQVKNEVKPENVDAADGRTDEVFQRQNFQGRVHLSYKLTKSLEWRSQGICGFFRNKKRAAYWYCHVARHQLPGGWFAYFFQCPFCPFRHR